MRLEKCIMQVPKGTTEKSGMATIPDGVFEFLKNMTPPYKFLVVKKRKEKILKLIPVESNRKIYEIYCEVIDNQRIGNVVEFISKFVHKYADLKLLSEIHGICMGDGTKYPCTFDGFIVLEGNDDSLFKELKNNLINLSSEGNTILSEISITEVI